MSNRQVVFTASEEQIYKLIAMAELINRNLSVGDSKVDIKVPTLEEREEALRAKLNLFQLQEQQKRKSRSYR